VLRKSRRGLVITVLRPSTRNLVLSDCQQNAHRLSSSDDTKTNLLGHQGYLHPGNPTTETVRTIRTLEQFPVKPDTFRSSSERNIGRCGCSVKEPGLGERIKTQDTMSVQVCATTNIAAICDHRRGCRFLGARRTLKGLLKGLATFSARDLGWHLICGILRCTFSGGQGRTLATRSDTACPALR
jgi:hypothetical protein